ncbi:hypothetical protein [Microcoleus sp. AT9b-C3]|uniref:hypothetical protein n=1 Tax=Microcoleus sp. AT9b-C3 TaxID=2818629 RepID=UPI002FCFCAE5
MADYTFESSIDLLKNDNSIQVVFDVDVLAAPAKVALAAYIASLGLPAAQTQHLLWQNIGVAAFIDSLAITYYLPSLGNQTPAPDLKRTSSMKDKVVEMQSLESKFPKCQMLMFTRSSSAAAWVWRNTEVIQNSGNRVNTLKLLPYLNQKDVFVPGRATQIGIQFIADPASNSTLPQTGDRVTVHGSIGLDVNPIEELKKNNETEQLKIRMATLETLLQPFGAATATAAGTTGLVPGAAAGQSEYLLRGDRTWQEAAAFVSSTKDVTINGNKTFSQLVNFLKEIVITGVGSLTGYSARTAATLFATGANSYLSLSASSAPVNSKLVDLELSNAGTITMRRLNDAYNRVVSTILTTDAANNLNLPGFTKLGGDAAIRVKRLQGTTAPGQGENIAISHGIDGAKIVSCDVIVSYSDTSYVGPGFANVAGYEFDWTFSISGVSIRNKLNNSANILSKPFTVLLIYTN